MSALSLVGPSHFDALAIDPAKEADRIAEALRRQLLGSLRRRGLVLGLSGGVDSSVCAALAARAVGPANVLCLLMPEFDSDPESLELGRRVAEAFGLTWQVEDVGLPLAALGCYDRRDGLVRTLEPAYGAGWGCKVTIADTANGAGYALSSLVVRAPDGTETRHRLDAPTYLGLVAATNMKQRVRKLMEYSHADRLNYAVLGTPNRLEYDQGFFVKNGDGAADTKPIAHLYKCQVYQLAEYLGVPKAVTDKAPTTDTWSLPQTQEEFYFSLPTARMDLCLYGLDNGIPASEVAEAAGIPESGVVGVWRDIRNKRRTTRPLHMAPLLVEPVIHDNA